MNAPAFWQVYLIVGALYSLRVLYEPGFEKRYQRFVDGSRISAVPAGARVAAGCLSVTLCLIIWLPLAIMALVAWLAGRR